MTFRSLVRRLWLPLLAAVIIAIPAAAQAETTNIEINPGNVPTMADAFADDECSAAEGEVVWVFNLPGGGTFVSVTATFAEGTLPATVQGGPGTSKATVTTPEGWTLLGATAVAEDPKQEFFVLTHTCLGEEVPPTSEPPTSEPPTSEPPTSEPPTSEPPTSEPPTSEPPTSEPPTSEPPTSEPPEETTSPHETTPPEETTSPAKAAPPVESTSPAKAAPPAETTTTRDSKGGLTTTGTGLTGIIGAGLALLAAGIGALYLIRRRNNATDIE